jgi:hypothetical protein
MREQKSPAFRLLLGTVISIAGCSDHTKFEGASVTVGNPGHTVELQLGDCRVYKVERGWLGTVRQTRVVSTDFYLGYTVCTRQSLVKEGDYAIATLCRQAVGAGGGCASSGTYRSRDGAKWEKEVDGSKWVPLDEGDASEASDSVKTAPKPPATPET